MQRLCFETAVADEVSRRAFLKLPFERGVEKVPKVRVGLAWVGVAVIVQFGTFGSEQGGGDVVAVSSEMGRREELMERMAG